MANVYTPHGQALVEVALVMPLLILFWAVILSLVFMVRTKILLDEAAMHVAYAGAVGKNTTSASVIELFKVKSQGVIQGIPGVPSMQTTSIDSWQNYSFPAIHTFQEHGNILGVTLSYVALPWPAARSWFPWFTLKAYSEMPVDPSLTEAQNDQS